MFDIIRKSKAQAIIQKRDLNVQEQNNLDRCIEVSRVNYDQAFKESLTACGMPIRVGVYGICISGDNVLMTHTQSGTKAILNFPGGAIDAQEGFVKALERECKEELGCTIKIKEFIHSSNALYVHQDFPNSCMFNLYYTTEIVDDIENGELMGSSK